MKLQTKLAAGIIPLVLAAVLVLGLWAIHSFREELIESSIKRVQIVIDEIVGNVLERPVKMLREYGLSDIQAYRSEYQREALRALNDINIREEVMFLVFDRSGNLIFTSSPELGGISEIEKVWKPVASKFQELNIRFHLDIQNRRGSHGQSWLYVAHFFPDWDWVIIGILPDTEISNSMFPVYMGTLAIGLTCALGSLLLILGMLDRFYVRPVKQLKLSAQAYARGELDQKIQIATRDELEDLAANLNEMAARLKKSIEEKENYAATVVNRNSLLEREMAERKKAESISRKQQLAIELMSDAVVTSTPEGVILDCNPGAERMFGYTRGDHIGNSQLDLLPCRDRDKTGTLILEALGSKGKWIGETRFERKNRTLGYRSVTLAVVRDEAGNISAYTSVNYDITARRIAELALEEANRNLEEKVRYRTEELEESNRKMQTEVREHHRTQQQLLAYQRDLRLLASEITLVSARERQALAKQLHDGLGQNLALVKIQIEALAKKFSDDRSEAPFFEVANLLKKSIVFTRTITHELSPPMMLSQDIGATLEWLGEEILNKNGIAFSYTQKGFALDFPEDQRTLVVLIVRELMINIVKHAGATEATMDIRSGSGGVELLLSDNGVGFSPDSLLPKRRTEGLGIFSVHERIAYLNGRMLISSSPGKGCRISLQFPPQGAAQRVASLHCDL